MSHTIREKKRLLDRVRRLKGQIEAIERGLEEEREAAGILHTLAACRGALNGLMAEVMEGHIREHVVARDHPLRKPQAEAVEELIDVLKTYLR